MDCHPVEGNRRLTGVGEVIAVKSGYRWVGERSRVRVSEVLLVCRLLFLGVSIFAERFVPIGARHRAIEQEVDCRRYCLDVAVFLGRDVADKIVEWSILLLAAEIEGLEREFISVDISPNFPPISS